MPGCIHCTLTTEPMNCSTERTFVASSDAYLSLDSYRTDASLRLSDRNSDETVILKGFSTKQLRSAVDGYVSGLKYHDHERIAALEFVKELQITCKDVIERLDPEQSKTTAS